MRVLVRGGQITMHSVRMLKQVIKNLLKIALLIIACFTTYSLVKSISLYQVKIFFIYSLAKTLDALNLGKVNLGITNSYNERYLSSASEIVNNQGAYDVYLYLIDFIKITITSATYYSLIFVALVIVIFLLRGFSLSKNDILKGKDIVSDSNLKRQIFFFNLKERLSNLSFIVNFFKNLISIRKLSDLSTFYYKVKLISIAGINYPINSEKTHTIIAGRTGTGKSVLISDMINQVKKRKEKAIIYDQNGDYINKFYNPKTDIILNPFDNRSVNWNILGEIEQEAHCDNIAKTMVPDGRRNGESSTWENAARGILSESFKFLKEKNKAHNRFLKEIFFSKDESLFEELKEHSGTMKKLIPQESQGTSASVLFTVMSYVKHIKFLTNSGDNSFSIRKWIKDEKQKGILFISSKPDQHESLKPIISSAIDIAINSLVSLTPDRNRRIWLFLDELQTLGFLPSIIDGLTLARKNGGSFVMSTQLIAQLKNIYGDNLAKTIKGNAATSIFFTTSDKETANWCSDNLGSIEVAEMQESASYGSHEMRDGINISKNTKSKNVILATEIMNLPNLQCYLKFSGGFAVCKAKIKVKDYINKQDNFLENESILGFQNDNSNAKDKPIVRADYNHKLNDERDRKSQIILDLIRSEAKEGNIYTNKLFSERFEDKKSLGNADAIGKRISILSTKGYIKFNRNYQDLGFKDDVKNKFGILCVKDMNFGDINIIPTHYKSPDVGTILEIEDESKINWQDEDNLPTEDQEGNQNIAPIPEESLDLTFTEIYDNNESEAQIENLEIKETSNNSQEENQQEEEFEEDDLDDESDNNNLILPK